jgi:hypothetical protein
MGIRSLLAIVAASLLAAQTVHMQPAPAQYLSMTTVYASKQTEAQVNGYLDFVLDSDPTASQALVLLIHPRIPSQNLREYLYDIAFARTRAEFYQPRKTLDVPLTQMRTYLDDVADDKCPEQIVANIPDQNVREALSHASVKAFLACPLKRSNGFLIGAVLMLWSGKLPTYLQLTESEKVLRDNAPLIASKLESSANNLR